MIKCSKNWKLISVVISTNTMFLRINHQAVNTVLPKTWNIVYTCRLKLERFWGRHQKSPRPNINAGHNPLLRQEAHKPNKYNFFHFSQNIFKLVFVQKAIARATSPSTRRRSTSPLRSSPAPGKDPNISQTFDKVSKVAHKIDPTVDYQPKSSQQGIFD